MAPSDTSLAGKHCLVLDDEFLIALDIREILEAAGAAKVICVSDEASAMAALHTGSKFHFGVLDLLLGDMTKTSLAVAVILDAKKIPFVFLTGMPGEDRHIKKFPTAPVLEKPYQAPLLMETVLRILGSR